MYTIKQYLIFCFKKKIWNQKFKKTYIVNLLHSEKHGFAAQIHYTKEEQNKFYLNNNKAVSIKRAKPLKINTRNALRFIGADKKFKKNKQNRWTKSM